MIPGNRNADNADVKLRAFEHIVYPAVTIQTDGIRAGLLKSFGFGQVNGEVVVVHPDYALAALSEAEYTAYIERRAARQRAAYRALHDALANVASIVRIKTHPPYAVADQSRVYLDPLARAQWDPAAGTWMVKPFAAGSPSSPSLPMPAPAQSAPSPPQALAAALAGALQSSVGAVGAAATAADGTTPPGVGIDLERVVDVASTNDTFVANNFTPAEIAYCRAAPDPAASFAGRWCAKEAVIKAVSSRAPEQGRLWRSAAAPLAEIEIQLSPSGAPAVVFHGAARDVVARAGVTAVTVSITHAGEYAMAVAHAV